MRLGVFGYRINAQRSIRATNVYEEQSLGIFDGEEDGEFHFQPIGSRATVWSQYLSLHARRLLAFGK